MAITLHCILCFQQSHGRVEHSASDQYIKSKAVIYGRDPNKKITLYQKQVNTAAIELALADPSILQNCKLLLERARSKINDSGYKFKKGRSRSKLQVTNDTRESPKHKKNN